MKTRYKTGLLLIAMPVILLAGCAKAGGEEKAEEGYVQETDSAPSSEREEASAQVSFEAQDMEGGVVSSAVFAGSKLTMVNVWATYCNPCLREMPGLGELAKEYDSEEFQLIGIISDVQEGADQKTMNLAKDLIGQTGADYPHLLLNESLYFALLTDVAAVPTTFFIDENGLVLDTVIGSMEKAAWKERIDALLEEQ